MRLSIVIPAHNEEDCIVDLINMIIELRISVPYELIVVDDHCDDSTAKLVKEMSDKHANIKLVKNTFF